MTKLKFWFSALLLLCFISINGQEKKKIYKAHTIAFYNLENLFDTINDPLKFDEASPMMELKTGRQKVYKKKVQNMARVISDIGHDVTKNSPVIVGVSEIEDRIKSIQKQHENTTIKSENTAESRSLSWTSPTTRRIW